MYVILFHTYISTKYRISCNIYLNTFKKKWYKYGFSQILAITISKITNTLAKKQRESVMKSLKSHEEIGKRICHQQYGFKESQLNLDKNLK